MSRTNIDIDDELIATVMRQYHLKTKKDAVDFALRRVVKPKPDLEFILSMRGSGWDGDLEAISRTDPNDLP